MTTAPRKFLYADEIHQLCRGARKGGYEGIRDHALIWIAYTHALRCSELVALQWTHFDFKRHTFDVHRLKHGKPTLHQLSPRDEKLLEKWRKRQLRVYGGSIYVFTNNQGEPLTRRGIYGIVQRAGERAKLPFRVHPHALRHSRGFALANNKEDLRLIGHFMGHKNINSTLLYTEIDVSTIAGFESIEFQR